MNSNKRIAINTIVSYSRTIVAIFLALFSSRWALGELGTSDFGIFSLVGSILVFITFFNNVLATADSRFFAIEIGKGGNGNLKNLFKSSFIIHVVLPPILVIVGGSIGYYAITHWLNIPHNRIDASLKVFVISLFSILFSVVSVPYRALFIAYQNIVESSVLELLHTFLLFSSAFFLRYVNGDKLVNYALLYSCSTIISSLLFVGCAFTKYPCTRELCNARSNKFQMQSMLKFSLWSALGDFGHLIRTQGIAIIVNLLFSTPGNAALGIANQVSAQASGLSNSLMRSTSPEINRLVGSGDILSGQKLSSFVNKVGVLLMVALGIPLMVNMDSILKLWLVDVPPYTKDLCICFIAMYIIERFTMGHYMYMAAINKISRIQVAVFVSYSLCLVFPYLGLCKLYGLTGIGLSCIISMILGRICIELEYHRNTHCRMIKELEFALFSTAYVLIFYLIFLNFSLPNNWPTLILYCTFILVIIIPTYIILFFPKDDIMKVYQSIKK